MRRVFIFLIGFCAGILLSIVAYLLGMYINTGDFSTNIEVSDALSVPSLSKTLKEDSQPDALKKDLERSVPFNAVSQKSGTEVVITHTQLPEDMWLVVHDIQEDETIGTILGAKFAQKNQQQNGQLSIPLLRNTEPKHSYILVAYKDNGDGRFSVENDIVLRDTSESILYTLFNTL